MKEASIIRELYKDRKTDIILDDCYFFDGKYLITTDTIAEGTHFKHEWSSAADIAYKLIEVNVSDIAASGGLPKLAFLNLGLSQFSEKSLWLKPFLKHLQKALLKYNIKLEGGDTYHSTHTNLTLTLIGESKKPIFRHTGNNDDLVYITGCIGLSYLGYKILKNNLKLPLDIKKEAINRHLRPEARLELSKQISRKYKVSAMMDITDGLIQDGEKLALASKLKILIEVEKIPNISLLQKYMSIDEALSSGEELELLFLSKDKIKPTKDFPVTCIGRAIKGFPGIGFNLNESRYKPKKKGFLHFS